MATVLEALLRPATCRTMGKPVWEAVVEGTVREEEEEEWEVSGWGGKNAGGRGIQKHVPISSPCCSPFLSLFLYQQKMPGANPTRPIWASETCPDRREQKSPFLVEASKIAHTHADRQAQHRMLHALRWQSCNSRVDFVWIPLLQNNARCGSSSESSSESMHSVSLRF